MASTSVRGHIRDPLTEESPTLSSCDMSDVDSVERGRRSPIDYAPPRLQAQTSDISLNSSVTDPSFSVIRPSPSSPFQQTSKRSVEKLSTINGVFLPCISQILGVIFFLRLPTITAQAGTTGATMIIFVCVLSTFVTSLSLSAIASNGTIQAGGPYYIISRTLGVEIGGALGLLFYLGTTLGGSMYVMGAVETMQTNLNQGYSAGPAPWFGRTQIYTLLLMFIITKVVAVGVKYVNMSASFFLATVAVSIFCILIGTVLFATDIRDGGLSDEERIFNNNFLPNYSPDPKTGVTPTFTSLVALFYPSVTGIMAGTNRSAKLAKPNESIPTGTVGAIFVTTTLYLFQVWLLGSVVAHDTLLENKLVLASIAYPSQLIVKLGIITSCIGAALQCMVGAPQLLDAIAADGAIPFLRFVNPPGSRGESTRVIWVTWLIASGATLAGNLDHITPILTMFFLLMYGGINLCCFLLAWVDSPGFRPTFKYFNWKVSLFGFVWCLTMSLVISWAMALCAIGLFVLKYMYIRNKKVKDDDEASQSQQGIGADWGDVMDSLRYKITTTVLMKVTGTENLHAKNWRPQLLTVVDTDGRGNPLSMELIALAAQLKKGRGLNMAISIKKGSLLDAGTFGSAQKCRRGLKKSMDREGSKGFAEVAVTTSRFSEAVWSAVTHSGLGPVSPNTVLLPWMENWRVNAEMSRELVDTITGLTNMRIAVALFKGKMYPRKGSLVPTGSTIDIYWVVDDGGLTLLLPYILSKNIIFEGCVRLRVFAVATSTDEDPNQLERAVRDHLQSIRIHASVHAVDMRGTSLATDMRSLEGDRMTIGESFRRAIENSSDAEGGTRRKSVRSGRRRSSTSASQMDTASTFNDAIRHHSKGAKLIVTNLPVVERLANSSDFMAYVDKVCHEIDNVLFVRGSGAELLTTVA